MTTERFAIPDHLAAAVPLKGYLIKEAAEQLWVADQEGTWIINARDLAGRGEWSGVAGSQFSGRPGIFYVRDGAEINQVRTVKIRAAFDWPLAVGAKARDCEVAGYSSIDTRHSPYTYCKGPDGKWYICDNRAE